MMTRKKEQNNVDIRYNPHEITREMEVLGNRIDAIKKAKAAATSEWSKRYLEQVEISLTNRWREFILTRDCGFYSKSFVKNEGRAERNYRIY